MQERHGVAGDRAFLLLSVPLDLLEEAGISEDSILQMSAQRGRICISGMDDTGEVVCDGRCEICPCFDYCDEKEVLQ